MNRRRQVLEKFAEGAVVPSCQARRQQRITAPHAPDVNAAPGERQCEEASRRYSVVVIRRRQRRRTRGDGRAPARPVVVQDERDSAEYFQQFCADPGLQAFIVSVGGAPAPPEVIVSESVSSSGDF